MGYECVLKPKILVTGTDFSAGWVGVSCSGTCCDSYLTESC